MNTLTHQVAPEPKLSPDFTTVKKQIYKLHKDPSPCNTNLYYIYTVQHQKSNGNVSMREHTSTIMHYLRV